RTVDRVAGSTKTAIASVSLTIVPTRVSGGRSGSTLTGRGTDATVKIGAATGGGGGRREGGKSGRSRGVRKFPTGGACPGFPVWAFSVRVFPPRAFPVCVFSADAVGAAGVATR